MSEADIVVGIDLGTTNSEITAFVDGNIKVLGDVETIMPSAVGLAPNGELLIGRSAYNQALLYPERTVLSVKRRMGSQEKIRLGDRSFSPEEISSLILRELVSRASASLGTAIRRAVITVPAYFSDSQRRATREAGALAGLEVLRIVNEPTAASLAYGNSADHACTSLIYDLGGGTFDVSLVTTEQGVTEVQASHGNDKLGGNDFDELLLNWLLKAFRDKHGDIELPLTAMARLRRAAEEAKKLLSEAPHATVREEALVSRDGEPLHLEIEIHRSEYEALIRPLVESTFESLWKTLNDADKKPADLDDITLVGGSTRTPLIWQLLEERFGIVPRQEINPDLCVALGAGVLASRLEGRQVERVLVDVSPYSFGPSYLGERGQMPYLYCYRPVIKRNTPLPVTRTESYYTADPGQEAVHLEIYQGEDEDALKNVLVGHFKVDGLSSCEGPNEVLCRMRLDLDGCLQVSAIEKSTGLTKHITISNALSTRAPAEIAKLRQELETLYQKKSDEMLDSPMDNSNDNVIELPMNLTADEVAAQDSAAQAEASDDPEQDAWQARVTQANKLLERCRQLIAEMHEDDREEAIDLNETVVNALAEQDIVLLDQAENDLKELLFFIEGR